MQLENYISDLLYRYNCVTIPELGAFLAERISAQRHETTHIFYPPKKILSFNQQLQSNDGLLANYIAEVEKIPYKTALRKIEKHVASIKAYLNEGEAIHFQNIGDLVLNNEGNIVFDPSQHINYLTDAFGLSHFRSSNVTREVLKEKVVAIEAATPIAITPEKRATNHWFKYAAAALIIIGLSGFGVYYKHQSDAVENHNQIVQEEAKTLLEEKIQEATFVISNPLPDVTIPIKKKIGSYHIVGGAFRIKANSLKKVQQLLDKGYKAKAIGKNRYGLHEVVYGSYATRSEAQIALREIRKNHNPEAWLLIKKLD